MNSSLLTIITTIAEAGALGGLLWQLILSRRESKARFMIDVYNDQEEKLNKTLADDSRLDIYAKKRGITRAEAKEKILATIDINDAFKNYVIYTEKLVGSDLGEKFAMDIKGVISRPQVNEIWTQIKNFYPIDFQIFVESKPEK